MRSLTELLGMLVLRLLPRGALYTFFRDDDDFAGVGFSCHSAFLHKTVLALGSLSLLV